jgi:hypothetical protein
MESVSMVVGRDSAVGKATVYTTHDQLPDDRLMLKHASAVL